MKNSVSASKASSTLKTASHVTLVPSYCHLNLGFERSVLKLSIGSEGAV